MKSLQVVDKVCGLVNLKDGTTLFKNGRIVYGDVDCVNEVSVQTGEEDMEGELVQMMEKSDEIVKIANLGFHGYDKESVDKVRAAK